MFLKKLYSRRSDGGLQEWQIEVEGNRYRAISGMVEGAKVTAEWTVVKGKNIGRANATTDDQQAAAEAQSKYQKKVDSGYRASVAELETVTLFDCMLAHKWKDFADKAVLPLWVQPKLDGARCIGRASGLFSRKGKPWISVPHIWEALKLVFDKYPDLYIDGELYADKLKDDFNTIIHLIKQTKPTPEDLDASAKVIKYFVYDCMFGDNPDMIFSERNKKIREILKDNPAVVLVDTHLAKDQDELDRYYSEWLAAGYEGEMVRQDVAYQNKRTSALLKRKEHIDEEYTITDIVEGIGNRAGTAGAVTLHNGDKPQFNAGIRGNRQYVVKMLQDRKLLIGKQATIRYQNLSPDGVPRFPVMISVRDYE